MAKTPKKRANTKGAAKKVHKKVKKPTRSCLAAVVEQEAKKRGGKPNLVHDLRQTNLDTLREPKADPADFGMEAPTGSAILARREEALTNQGAELDAKLAGGQRIVGQLAAAAMSSKNLSASISKPKRYRFRDAITGLFVRAAAALKRPFTTVRERVR